MEPSPKISSTDWLRTLIAFDNMEALAQLEELEAAAERDRAVGVLDAWATEIDPDYPLRIRTWSLSASGPGIACAYSCGGIEEYGGHGEEAWTIFSVHGATPDAARAVAATVIQNGKV
jgi:hypothetical protein